MNNNLKNLIDRHLPESSRATTERGKIRAALRALREHRASGNVRPIPGARLRPASEMRWCRPATVTRQFTEFERQQRRASEDKRYRKNILSRIRRAIKQIENPPAAKSLSDACQKVFWPCYMSQDTLDHLMRVVGNSQRIPEIPEAGANYCVLPRWRVDRKTAKRLLPGRDLPRWGGTDFHTSDATEITDENGQWRFKDSDNPAMGPADGRAYWTPGLHEVTIQAVACVLDKGRRLEVRLGDTTTKIDAADGQRWDVDAYGLRLVGKKWDYHPTTNDILRGMTVEDMQRRGEESRRQRIVEKMRQRNEKKSRSEILRKAADIYVCAGDSRAAGNCLQGTMTWVKNHGLRGHHVQGDTLISFASEPRVFNVLSAAVRRHRAEMQQGYSDLCYHYAQ
jgi:hypothetical protein